MQNIQSKYSVHKARLTTKDGPVVVYLVLEDGLPMLDVNNVLLAKVRDYGRPSSTLQYRVCKYFNWLAHNGIDSYLMASMETVHKFLQFLYIEERVSYDVLHGYNQVIDQLYEAAAVLGKELDPSLYRPKVGNATLVLKESHRDHITKVNRLYTLFRPRENRSWESYTKWYTAAQVEAIAAELSLMYRCIFLLTVYLGYRSSGAISVLLTTLDLRKRQIKPSHSKTGKMHVSLMPEKLAQLLRSYVETDRPKNPGCDSAYLFVNGWGNPVNYHNYYNALQRAAVKVRQKHPELALGAVHTHAGRSTFAAALRSYQLREQRLGHKTFSDADFCDLMDWQSLQCLKDYDKAVRIQEISPLVQGFHEAFMLTIDENTSIIRT